MDQDKAQQSIDTLSEKVNGVVRSVRVSCSPENDYRGEKDYRSVFGVQEIECLYVDTEVLNKQFEGEPWEGKMTVRLFRLENGKGQCLSVKESGIKVERQDALPVYEEWIDRADLPEQAWKQGISWRISTEWPDNRKICISSRGRGNPKNIFASCMPVWTVFVKKPSPRLRNVLILSGCSMPPD